MGNRPTCVIHAVAVLVLTGCIQPTTNDSQNHSSRFSVQIQPSQITLDSGANQEASTRPNVTASGGTVEEASWNTIESPPGGMVGILDYEDYAVLQITGEGNYTIQLTATSKNGTIARDTADVQVR